MERRKEGGREGGVIEKGREGGVASYKVVCLPGQRLSLTHANTHTHTHTHIHAHSAISSPLLPLSLPLSLSPSPPSSIRPFLFYSGAAVSLFMFKTYLPRFPVYSPLSISTYPHFSISLYPSPPLPLSTSLYPSPWLCT